MKTKAVIVIRRTDGTIRDTIPCESVDGMKSIENAATYWKDMYPACSIEVYSFHSKID